MIYECPLLGHPDKAADIVSDAILDQQLQIDPEARVACEVMLAKGTVFIGGEISNFDEARAEEAVRKQLCRLGYRTADDGIGGMDCRVAFSVSEQSTSLRDAIGMQLNAGDQSIVVGYATKETAESLPESVVLGKKFARALSYADIPGKRPDGKIFLKENRSDASGVRYDVVASVHHSSAVGPEEFRRNIRDVAINLFGNKIASENFQVNPPSGEFTVGGPAADVGITGRKLIAEGYGPHVPHGGGALSGKDCTKVDRAGAYAARCVARSLVSAGLVDEATVFIGYMIGEPDPVYLQIRDESRARDDISQHVLSKVDLSLSAIIDFLKLRDPVFSRSSEAFHYGMDKTLSWEEALFEL